MVDRLGLVVKSATPMPKKARAAGADATSDVGDSVAALGGQSSAAEDTIADPLKGGDVYGWARDQAALIRGGRHAEIDWINVADEIESVGRSETNTLRSELTVLLQHLLKWDYQPARRSRSWQLTIREHRRRVDRSLRENPSLKPRLAALCAEAFADGRDRALAETGMKDADIATQCPYDWDAIMMRPFVLDQTDEAAP